MRAAALLAQARSAGLAVELAGDQLAVSGKHPPPAALLAAIRTAKAEIVEYLQADHMPRGVGICPGCGEVRWLRAGPTTTVCEDCEAGRSLRSGAHAGDMRHADDEAEVTLRGEASR